MVRFLPGLHGLRAIAAITVILSHAANLTTTFARHEDVWIIQLYFGGLGVQLFFVLSAFSLAHSTFDRTGRADWVKAYAIKRFFRIAPLFYAAILFFYFYGHYVWGVNWRPKDVFLTASFAFNFVPGSHESIVPAGWTIGVEMIFYAIFPIMLLITSNIWRGLIIFLLSCVVCVLATDSLKGISGIPPSYPSLSFIHSIPSFAAGLLAFQVFRFISEGAFNKRVVALSAIAVALLAFLLSWKVPYDFTLAWAVMFGSLCVWQAYAPEGIISSWPFQYAGERSYSLYLAHPLIVGSLAPIYAFVRSVLSPIDGPATAILNGVIAVACVLVVASLTYRFIEAPFIRFGEKLITGRAPIKGSLPVGGVPAPEPP